MENDNHEQENYGVQGKDKLFQFNATFIDHSQFFKTNKEQQQKTQQEFFLKCQQNPQTNNTHDQGNNFLPEGTVRGLYAERRGELKYPANMQFP